ncbi:bacterioferritin-associated ferredoxin [Pseudoalteromonas tunicata]|jgi:bacterioferritin-associated ferredoxin|uniref:Bacterioferritin-associated ferredoxin n=1 Tax=Pseudoalteromonas tunicata D2 TaxID=87626 RepID=A4C8X5_9GAMM|nr:bacterioferritin-associated ferredoxin [Pseudoalteromonas tunicata]ATC93543.1 bacterioferritin-associated ferredoxin [Pseudoalteromonas tunicata]AXT29386.1 (2Fe-2S)-binding protein [Pseudoalteromonas tunicata]EAR29040.1 BFD-like (2Fe-2S)-binding region protein [Pseudoalteromonas tunicata D2]MDP4984123.1 bacterioferritin-associated ferredoxin [Pseudoalteromonas tunicata]MDP5211760.1 bacterioferritin-associated ferredoxin [Pseudoalteromonas tunicata]
MYVCICHAVTDKKITQAVAEGVESMRQLRHCLGVGSQCGKCVCHAQQVLMEAQQVKISFQLQREVA